MLSVEVHSYWPSQLLLKNIWGVLSYSVRASLTAESERVLCVYKGSKICFGFEFCRGALIFSISRFLQLGVELWLPWFICNDLPKRPAEPRLRSVVLCAFMKCIISFVDKDTERVTGCLTGSSGARHPFRNRNTCIRLFDFFIKSTQRELNF